MSFESFPPTEVDATELFFCVIGARYNSELVDALLTDIANSLRSAGVRPDHLTTTRVPGSNELPYAAYMHAMTGQFDAIIAAGVVVAGDTNHHDVIARATATAFHEIGMRTEVPVINGVLTTNSVEQARERIGKPHYRGREFARAAMEMAQMKVQAQARLDNIEDSREDAIGQHDKEEDQ